MEAANQNRVGIIGAGRLGQAMARVVLRAGRPVVIANSRGPDTIDLGPLTAGGAMQQLGGPLAGVNLIALSGAN